MLENCLATREVKIIVSPGNELIQLGINNLLSLFSFYYLPPNFDITSVILLSILIAFS